jgi:ketosteroid isomerase-like protein
MVSSHRNEADDALVHNCSTTTEVTLFTNKLLTFFAPVCLFLIGCTHTPTVDIRAEADALRNIEGQWTAATKARDIDKIVSLTAPDIVVMDANAPLGVGHQALRKSVESWLADTLVSRTLSETVDAVEVSAFGDLAYTRGTDRFSHNTPKGIVEEVGKWVTIYKKVDGKWRAIVDIGNSDKPPSGQ